MSVVRKLVLQLRSEMSRLEDRVKMLEQPAAGKEVQKAAGSAAAEQVEHSQLTQLLVHYNEQPQKQKLRVEHYTGISDLVADLVCAIACSCEYVEPMVELLDANIPNPCTISAPGGEWHAILLHEGVTYLKKRTYVKLTDDKKSFALILFYAQ